jgi:phage tail-like protein
VNETPSGATPPNLGRLIVRVDGEVRFAMPLAQEVLLIGREPSSDLTLPDPTVSRTHAEIRMESVGPVLTDLGSSNGTFVGQSRLLPQQPRVLRHGDSFRIGPFTITYEAEGMEAVVPAQEQQAMSEPAELAAAAAATRLMPVMAPPPPPTRPTYPAPTAPGIVSSYLRYLPGIFHEGDFLGRYLLIEESIWEPLEQRQDHIDMYFDPRTCPSSFLPWMASWFDLPHHAHWPESRIRARLAQAVDLYRWRGTPYGLVRMIEVTTGVTPEITENPDEPFIFHIRVPAAHGVEIDRDLIEGLIEAHKPAHAGYVIDMET